MKLISLILVLSLVSSAAFGVECKQSVSLLNEGAVAPCTGWLFDPPSAKEASNNKLQLPILQDETTLYQNQVIKLKKELADEEAIADDQSKKAELWRTRAVDVTEKYVSVENSRGTRDMLFYGAGVVTMLLLIFAESQAQQRR